MMSDDDHTKTVEQLDYIDARLNALTRERDELREALAPIIVRGCSQATDEHSDTSPVELELTVGEFRRLARAHRGTGSIRDPFHRSTCFHRSEGGDHCFTL